MTNDWTITAVGEVTAEPQRIVGLFPAAGRAVGRAPIEPGGRPARRAPRHRRRRARAELVGALLAALPPGGPPRSSPTSTGTATTPSAAACCAASTPRPTWPPRSRRSASSSSPMRSARTTRASSPPRSARSPPPTSTSTAGVTGCSRRSSWASPSSRGRGLERRADPELARMAAALIAERRPPGATVSADMTADRHHHHDTRSLNMRIFDPHIHMTPAPPTTTRPWRGRRARASSSRRSGSASRAPSVGTFVDYFDALIGWERFRAAQFGIRHHCTIAPQPQGGERRPLPRGARRAAALPREGRRRRRRRDRLRLDDARGGERLRRASSSWPRRTTCRRWCTPRTATRRRARRAPWTSCASRASRPSGSSSTTSTR